jgi:hypothetical protein
MNKYHVFLGLLSILISSHSSAMHTIGSSLKDGAVHARIHLSKTRTLVVVYHKKATQTESARAEAEECTDIVSNTLVPPRHPDSGKKPNFLELPKLVQAASFKHDLETARSSDSSRSSRSSSSVSTSSERSLSSSATSSPERSPSTTPRVEEKELALALIAVH